jgi:hypothetical protein
MPVDLCINDPKKMFGEFLKGIRSIHILHIAVGGIGYLNFAAFFGNSNQWASVIKVAPLQFKLIASYDKNFGTTIHLQ